MQNAEKFYSIWFIVVLEIKVKIPPTTYCAIIFHHFIELWVTNILETLIVQNWIKWPKKIVQQDLKIRRKKISVKKFF